VRPILSTLHNSDCFLSGRTYYNHMFTAVFQSCDGWWAAYVEEVPGVNTQGKTLDEARENLKEALSLVLQCNRELARQNEPANCIREPLIMPA
jgi:predicted RNase H-like HicB family nuclease